VGLAAAAREAAERPTASPIVTLATAHPAKFPAAIRAATGRTAPEPESVTRQRNARERVEALPNDIGVIANHISSRTRAKRATT
jgi:threonine synthase